MMLQSNNLRDLSFSDLWALHQFADVFMKHAKEAYLDEINASGRKAVSDYISKWSLLQNGIAHAINDKTFKHETL